MKCGHDGEHAEVSPLIASFELHTRDEISLSFVHEHGSIARRLATGDELDQCVFVGALAAK